MRREADALVLARRLARAGALQANLIGWEELVSQHCVSDARVWPTHATLAGFIISAPLLFSMPANGQAMSHDMPGMEHEHHGTAPAPQQQSPPASSTQQPSPAMPEMTHQESPGGTQGAIPEQGATPEHGGHGKTPLGVDSMPISPFEHSELGVFHTFFHFSTLLTETANQRPESNGNSIGWIS